MTTGGNRVSAQAVMVPRRIPGTGGLVFELAVLDSGEANMRTQFPIETSPDGFEARKKPHKSGAPNWLTGVSHEHCGMIEMLQPCNGVNWIEFLRDLSNEDKHRTIPVFGYAGAGTINVGGTDEDVAAMGGYRIPGRAATRSNQLERRPPVGEHEGPRRRADRP